MRFPSKSALGSVHGAPCTTPDSGLEEFLELKAKKLNQPVNMMIHVLVSIEIGFGLLKSSVSDPSVVRQHWIIDVIILDQISELRLVLSYPVSLIK